MDKVISIRKKTKSNEELNTVLISKSSQSKVQNPQLKTKKTITFLNGVIMISLIALFFGIPVFFTGITMQGLGFEKQLWFYVWLLIGVVAWVIKGSSEGEMHIRRTPLDIPILAVLLTYLISMFFSIDRWHSFWGFFGDPSRSLTSVLALALAYFFLISNFTLSRARAMIIALLASNGVVALWTTLAIFGVKFLPTKIIVFAPLSLLGSFGALTTFFAMMLPILATCILLLLGNEKINKPSKILGISFCALLTVGNLFLIFALYAFVPWLALLVGVSFFLIYTISHLVAVKEGLSWIPIGIFVVILSFLLIGSSFGSFKIGKIDFPVEISPSYGLSWTVAKDAIKHNFLVGSGPGTYGYAFSKYKPQSFNNNSFYDLRFSQGTGLFLEALSTSGALAMIALIVLVLSFVGTGIYLMAKNKNQNKLYSLGLLSVSFVFLISALSVQTQGSMLIIGCLIISLAVAMLLAESDTEKSSLDLSFKTSPKYALTLAFVIILVSAGVVIAFLFIGRAYVADVFAGKATRTQDITGDGSISDLSKAISIFPNEGRYYTAVSQQYMALANKEFSKPDDQRNVGALQQYITAATSAAQQGEDLSDKDVFAVQSAAQVYENAIFYSASAEQAAENEYAKALELDPNNPVYQIKLGQLKMSLAASQKDEARKHSFQEAKGFFEKAISEKYNLAPAHYNLAIALNDLGDIDRAIEKLGNAVQLENNNVTYLFNLAQLYQKRANGDDEKIAEALYKEVLRYNDKEINSYISLGILNEKMNKNDEAISDYQKVLDALPAEDYANRDKMKELISNVKNGIKNTFENIAAKNQSTENQPTEKQ